jgi:sigma-B regulation protein RsbU (phosphoserine phosphatase)
VFRIDDRFVALYVLDVSGHGVPAALLSVTATKSLSPSARQAVLTTLPSGSPEDISPAEVAAKVNSLYPMEDNGGHYFTLLYGILDMETRRLRFTCAGHPGPILSRAGEPPASFDAPAPPIGMVPYDYEEQVIELTSGDRLYLHTDGINEEENPSGERFGRERLLAAIERCRSMTLDESVESLVEEVVAWHGDEHLADDISLLAVEIV